MLTSVHMCTELARMCFLVYRWLQLFNSPSTLTGASIKYSQCSSSELEVVQLTGRASKALWKELMLHVSASSASKQRFRSRIVNEIIHLRWFFSAWKHTVNGTTLPRKRSSLFHPPPSPLASLFAFWFTRSHLDGYVLIFHSFVTLWWLANR